MANPNHIETLLTTIGIPSDDVQKIVSLPEADQAMFDAKPYAEKVRTNYQTQLQNDPAFFNDLTLDKLPVDIKKKLESTQYGRASAIVRDKVLKGLGMTEADLAELPEEQREKLEAFIPAITERFAKTKAGDKQLQADLIEARKKLESFNGLEDQLKTKYESESNQRIKAAIFKANLISELSAIPGLKIPAADIAATADNILQTNYGFETVGEYAVELRQKSNPQMKVLKENSSQELTLKDALTALATERGWIEKDDKQQAGTGRIAVTPNGNGQLDMVVPPHLRDKFQSKIASEK